MNRTARWPRRHGWGFQCARESLNVRIVSDLRGLSLVRGIAWYALLAKEMAPGGIHALSIKAEPAGDRLKNVLKLFYISCGVMSEQVV